LRRRYEGIGELLVPSTSRAQVIEEIAHIFRSSHGQGVNSVQQVSVQLDAYRVRLHKKITDKEVHQEIDEVIQSIQHKLEQEPGFLENSVAWIDSNLKRAGHSSMFAHVKTHHEVKHHS
jgi:hypothetical protein